MKHRCFSNPLRFLGVILALALAGCGGTADSASSNAQIRVLNLSAGYESLDLYTKNEDDDADKQQFSAVAKGSVSSYSSLKGDTYTLKFRKSGTTGDLLAVSTELADDTHLTLVAYGATNAFNVQPIDDDVEAPTSGYTKVQVLNTLGTEAFDVYLTGAGDSLDDVTATVAATNAGALSSVVTVSSGSFRLRVTSAGKKSDLRLNVPEISLPTAGVVTIILTETTGGVLVNAILLPKQGQPTTYDNTASASIRVLNVSTGYESIDLFTTSGGSSTDTQLFGAIARGAASAYSSLKADSYTLKFRKTGAAGNLLTFETTLVEDRRVTLVAYGSSSRFAVVALDDDTTSPDTSYTKVQVLNGTTADKLDVYLTGTDDSLENVAAAVGDVPAGTLSSFTTVRSGSYRLRITGHDSKTDLRLSVPEVALPSTGVVSIILTEAAGGVLVNAVVLPRQSAPIVQNNNTVRIRGAAGLSTGSTVSMGVAGTEIVTRRSARSYIADTYATLTSGNAAITVSVDNVVVASGTAALQAGKDYTLLAWDGGGTTQIALIEDDNRASISHRARLRLLNAMSGVAVPLTLAVNYSPIAEYIEVGTVSPLTELTAGTDYRLDITNAQNLALILSREAVPLLADGVYTLLVAGGGASTVTGTLRKDR